MAPPSANALAGYQQTYVTDFAGSSLPDGWGTYGGSPGNDPGTQWESSQVVVSNGLLQLAASYDSSQKEWITGGTSQNNVSNTYGAYFVRSRMTAPGATMVELLWPTNGPWPPEIDFNETFGPTNQSMATVHFNSTNNTDHRTIAIDMTKWHTWGVIWTPTSITYTVDGAVWGTVTAAANEIPNIPMHLAIQQQTWCQKGFACPTAPASDIVDWVVEYRAAATPAPVASGGSNSEQIAIDTSLPTWKLSTLVRHAAVKIVQSHATSITLNVTPVAPRTSGASAGSKVGEVISMLQHDVQLDYAKPLQIIVHWLSSLPVKYELCGNLVFDAVKLGAN